MIYYFIQPSAIVEAYVESVVDPNITFTLFVGSIL